MLTITLFLSFSFSSVYSAYVLTLKTVSDILEFVNECVSFVYTRIQDKNVGVFTYWCFKISINWI